MDFEKQKCFFHEVHRVRLLDEIFRPQKSAEKDPTLGASNNIKKSPKLLRILYIHNININIYILDYGFEPCKSGEDFHILVS